jgi:hypothetical protein
MNKFYSFKFETTATLRARFPNLYPPRTLCPGYTPRHWVCRNTIIHVTVHNLATGSAVNCNRISNYRVAFEEEEWTPIFRLHIKMDLERNYYFITCRLNNLYKIFVSFIFTQNFLLFNLLPFDIDRCSVEISELWIVRVGDIPLHISMNWTAAQA